MNHLVSCLCFLASPLTLTTNRPEKRHKCSIILLLLSSSARQVERRTPTLVKGEVETAREGGGAGVGRVRDRRVMVRAVGGGGGGREGGERGLGVPVLGKIMQSYHASHKGCKG